MSGTLFLDSTPLGLITQHRGKSAMVDACRHWYEDLNANGWTIYLPEITDYEVRRELTRSGKTASIARLDLLAATAIYLPLTTAAMRLASDLWAQALMLTPLPVGLVVATGDVAHLSRYLPAQEWTAITP